MHHIVTATATATALAVVALTGSSLEARRQQVAPKPVATLADTQPMTVTGCVKTWDPATLTAGGATAAGAAPQYVLISVETEPKDKPATPPGVPKPVTGTPAPTASGAHSTFLLSATPQSPDLATFVDQQVEVSGALVADGTVPPTAGTPPPAAKTAPATASADMKTKGPTPPAAFKVAAIKVVAKTCS